MENMKLEDKEFLTRTDIEDYIGKRRKKIDKNKCGLSQKYAAEMEGLKQQAMNDIFSGRKRLKLEHLCKIAGALGVPASSLLGERDIQIGDNEYREIQVLTNEGELIASVTAEDVIEKYGYKAVCIR